MNRIKHALCILCVFAMVVTLAAPVSAQSVNNPASSCGDHKTDAKMKSAQAVEDELPEDEVPLYNQHDYPDAPYGNYGTVSSHGCGITALAMVATYLTGIQYLPDELAERFGNYNSEQGSYLSLFEDSAEELNLGLQERTRSWEKVQAALENGQVVISLQKKGLFTGGGHFIVLTGMTEDGKVTVNDPNGDNYTKNAKLKKGFAEGFAPEQIKKAGSVYWIYNKKAARLTHDMLLSQNGADTLSPSVEDVRTPLGIRGIMPMFFDREIKATLLSCR